MVCGVVCAALKKKFAEPASRLFIKTVATWSQAVKEHRQGKNRNRQTPTFLSGLHWCCILENILLLLFFLQALTLCWSAHCCGVL
jgi:hypothetical protein